MFIMGIALELLKRWYILVLIVLLLIIRFFSPGIPIELPLVFLAIWVALALMAQFKTGNGPPEIGSNDEANGLRDKMFAGDDNGNTNTPDEANETIEGNNQNQYDKDSIYNESGKS